MNTLLNADSIHDNTLVFQADVDTSNLLATPDYNARYTMSQAVVLAAATKREMVAVSAEIAAYSAVMASIKTTKTTMVFTDTTTKHTADSRTAAIASALADNPQYQHAENVLRKYKTDLAILEANCDFYRYIRQALLAETQLRYAEAAEEYGIQ